MTLKIVILKINLTRTTRIAYNTLTVFIKPFNRTSMESKQEKNISVDPRGGPFNRTSMESKRCTLTDLPSQNPSPFNRTSMESKPPSRSVAPT